MMIPLRMTMRNQVMLMPFMMMMMMIMMMGAILGLS